MAMASPTAARNGVKYWKHPQVAGGEDIVIIHVCDENRQTSKDFCCKRNILVKHMKYFERFLAENENGYDDIDISVHCDVEIFEWLMMFIHEPDTPPVLEKTIVVSILISSEFLQMEQLVDLCLEHIATSLSEIIKLPIDLSCISEKLVNKLAALTHPKTLSHTKDRKDKILNKLYKRRVELDFSRKSGTKSGSKTIAASLTCCRFCGQVYLEKCVGLLSCCVAPPIIDFRGRLARTHSAIQGWSLTAYLKALHAGGMSWDSIYWQVWAACEVFRVGDVMISALEVDRYTIEPDGIAIRSKPCGDRDMAGSTSMTSQITELGSARVSATFNLGSEEVSGRVDTSLKLKAAHFEDPSLPATITPTLNPARPHDVLPFDVFELICSQMKFIAGLQHKQLIEATSKALLASSLAAEEPATVDFAELLWGDPGDGEEEEQSPRGRSQSPVGARGTRKQAHSLNGRPRGSMPGGAGAGDSGEEALGSERRIRSNSSNSAGAHRRGGAASTQRGGAKVRGRVGALGGDKDPESSRGGGAASTSRSDRGERGDKDKDKDKGSAEDAASEESIEAQELLSAIVRSMPTDVTRAVHTGKGRYRGLWLTPHPLQLQSNAFVDALAVIQESSLSEAKKLEWELDLLREHDEKRMDRFEAFLTARRTPSVEVQLRGGKGSGASRGGGMGARTKRRTAEDRFAGGEYYRDKGRQPYK